MRPSLKTLFTLSALLFSATFASANGIQRIKTDTELLCISEPLDSRGSIKIIRHSGHTGELSDTTEYYDGVVTTTRIQGASDVEQDHKIYVYGQRKAYRIQLTINRKILRKDLFNSRAVETSGGEFVAGKLVGARAIATIKYDCKVGG